MWKRIVGYKIARTSLVNLPLIVRTQHGKGIWLISLWRSALAAACVLVVAVALQAQQVLTPSADSSCDQSLSFATQGRGELAANEFPRAIADFRRAETLCPQTDATRLDFARAYLGAGEPLAAEREVRSYLSAYPNSEEGQFLFAYALYKRHQFRPAAQQLQTILNVDPTSVDALHLIGMALFFMHDYEGSRKAIENELKLRPDDQEALYFLAGDYYFGGDVSEAIRGYRRLLQLNPLSYQAWDALGLAEQFLLKDEAAASDFRKAERLAGRRNPSFTVPYTHLANLYVIRHKYAQAKPCVERALAMNPLSATNQYLMGKVLFQTGDVSSAVGYLEKSAELDKDFAEPHYLLLLAYRKLGQKNGAQRELVIFQQLKAKHEPKPVR